MKKITILASFVFALALTVTPTLAKTERVPESVNSFIVPAYSSTMTPVHVESSILEDGVEYTVKISGVANAGDYIDFDAQCSDKTNILPAEWTDYVQGYSSYGESLLDLMMDGNHDWGACAADHVYTKTVVGDGTSLDFYINDIYPINNTGSLNVEIIRTWKNHGQYVSSQENKQEAAHSRVGMPEQSKGHTKTK